MQIKIILNFLKKHFQKRIQLVLELKKDALEYFDYYEDEIEMRMELIEGDFVYEVEDVLQLPREILKNCAVYFDKNRYYIKIKKEVNMAQVLENVVSFHYKNNPFLLKEKNQIHY